MKITGKNIKSYATAQVHFPWEREGSLTAKSPNLSFKIYYPLLNFTSKLFQIGSFGQNSANYANSAQFAHTVREFRKIHTIRLTYYTLCFRHLPQQRTLQNSSELRKFHAIRPHSPRITRNLHHLLTLHLTFQMPDQWQRTP